MHKLTSALVVIGGACSSAAIAQAGPQPPDCSPSEHRQLDFIVGEWDVFNTADNVQYATSRFEKVMNGCGVRENYDSPKAPGGSYYGTSYSAYDRKDGKWHQMYVDTNGDVAWYTGLLSGNEMVLTAPGVGTKVRKMIYRPDANGAFRQIGSVSPDGGKSWNPGYDYTYRRRAAAAAAPERGR